MPYPFAHPAATLVLVRPLGRLAVPSALAIGSVVPDLWVFAPSMQRPESHGLVPLLGFCLPVGLLLYVLFHQLLKHPLIALLPPQLAARAAGFASVGLPRVPWHAVIASLLAGAMSHVAWDGLIELHQHVFHGPNWPRHVSTLVGTVVLVVWTKRQLRRVAPVTPRAPLSVAARTWTLAAFAAVVATTAGISALSMQGWWPLDDVEALRRLARTTALAAAQALCVGLFAYSLAWRLLKRS